MVTNSDYIAQRTRKYFKRDSVVIYPPVEMPAAPISNTRGHYYLTVGRLEKQKRVDILILACNALGRTLVIVGSGKEDKYLKSIAGPTIKFRGYVPDDSLPEIYGNSRAFLFAAVEDFGIAPVEAQAYGKPVIALGHGGSLETVRVADLEGRPDTGVFFLSQNVDSVIDAINRFEEREEQFNANAIQEHARKFDTQTFVSAITAFVNAAREREPSYDNCDH